MLPSLKTKIEEAIDALNEVIGTAEENGLATEEFKEQNTEWGKADAALKEANEYINSEASIS